MVKINFQDAQQRNTLQSYLNGALGEALQLVSVERFKASTRSAPWHVVVKGGAAERAFVLRIGNDIEEHEVSIMQALACIPEIPSPCVYGWDPSGAAFGVPCFLCDYIDGESLLQPILDDADWAVELYLHTVLQMNAITHEQLSTFGCSLPAGSSAMDDLANAHQFFLGRPSALTDQVYEQLTSQIPVFHEPCFSNGDLWLDNLLVREKQLVGVIDYEQAGFSDPVYEFLLPFFNEPRLRGRGIEERYCRALGVDPACLRWYHGLEYYDTLRYVERSGKAFNQYSSGRLRAELTCWLEGA